MIRMNENRSRRSSRAVLRAAAMVLSLGLAAEARADFGGSGLYRVTASVSGKVFDIDSTWWGGHLPGRELLQWALHGRSNQQFYFREVPGRPGIFEIRAGGERSNMCLDVPAFSTADGAIIQQWPCNGAANQRFRVVPAGPGTYQIQATHTASGLFVGDPSRNNAADDGARITLKRLDGACPSSRMLFSLTRI